MGKLDPWDVREPAGIIGDALRRCRPKAGDVLVALVTAGDDVDQALIDVTRVHRGALPRRRDASELLRLHAQSVAPTRSFVDGGWMPPRHVFVTVVCRSGRVVPCPDEMFWLMAWRYSNHLTAAFDGDVYLVTEHGWTGCADHRAGFTPALQPRPTHLAALPPDGRKPSRQTTAVSAPPRSRTAGRRRGARVGE